MLECKIRFLWLLVGSVRREGPGWWWAEKEVKSSHSQSLWLTAVTTNFLFKVWSRGMSANWLKLIQIANFSNNTHCTITYFQTAPGLASHAINNPHTITISTKTNVSFSCWRNKDVPKVRENHKIAAALCLVSISTLLFVILLISFNWSQSCLCEVIDITLTLLRLIGSRLLLLRERGDPRNSGVLLHHKQSINVANSKHIFQQWTHISTTMIFVCKMWICWIFYSQQWWNIYSTTHNILGRVSSKNWCSKQIEYC